MTPDLPEIDWSGTVTLRARWVFPVDRPPIESGTVEIAGGRIAAVDARRDRPTHDLGNAALLPGLVNAHAHLELSDVAQPLTPPRPFTHWLRSVMTHRRERGMSPEASTSAIGAGLTESRSSGTTLIGDIVSAGWIEPPAAGLRGVAFLELIGLSQERFAPQLEAASRHAGRATTGDWTAGLSPHAPYSVHPEFFERIVRFAAQARVPVAMHLAESREELELLQAGSGAFVEFLQSLELWRPEAIPRGTRIRDYLERLATLERALVIHGNYLADDDIELLAAHPGMSVVYCPRTHAYFGHEPHPWLALIARGINVALGTDSRASNPDLNVWDEVRFLRQRHPQVPPETLLNLATHNGARAMGQGHECGSLAVGNRAEWAAVRLPALDATDSYHLLFHPGSKVLPRSASSQDAVASAALRTDTDRRLGTVDSPDV